MADFRALVLTEEEGKVSSKIETLPDSALPKGEVTIAVDYSTLNYKDGMVLRGLGRLVRNYPHVPGIDLSGTVESSTASNFKPGDKVIVTGWSMGERHWGGYASKARVPAAWVTHLPKGLDTRQAMAVGTAGFTAMLAVLALEDHGLAPQKEGEVLVTGAAGGVGSVAVAVLAKLGYRVAAGTGRAEAGDYLKALGATSIVSRDELSASPKGPLASERWAGVIDNVGGPILANALAALRYWSSCASVGVAMNPAFSATVIPFVVRGVNLLGIDSGTCPAARRSQAWERLGRDLPLDKLEAMTTVAGLGDLDGLADRILKGQVRGRTVIDVRR
jgi:acrylyl-CoA reductase (NADPH)